MARGSTSLRKFSTSALLWLAVALAIWYPMREWMLLPAGWLAKQIMTASFPAWVAGAEIEGSTQVLLTRLRVWAVGGRVGELAPEV
ncbi:MAG: exosortase H-associated membrane protein, partial [Ramlibacter sp.]